MNAHTHTHSQATVNELGPSLQTDTAVAAKDGDGHGDDASHGVVSESQAGVSTGKDGDQEQQEGESGAATKVCVLHV